MDSMDKILVVLASLFATFLAGLFSMLTLVNNKEQKVSEFRQAWIDSLRMEISTLTASLFFISHYYSSNSDSSKKNEDAKNIEEAHKDYCKSCTAILMRINADDPDKDSNTINKKFLKSLNTIQNLFNENKYSEASIETKSLIDSSKGLLKSEWKRVKDGEKSYKHAKLLAYTLTIGMFVLSIVFLFINGIIFIS